MKYINPIVSKTLFKEIRRSRYFVDKSRLISTIVNCIGVSDKYLCITRPRRFGKTTNARMLACFLSRGLNAEDLFCGLEVSKDKNAMEHLGNHNVIYINFSALPDVCENYSDYINFIKQGIAQDVKDLLPEANIAKNAGPLETLDEAFNKTEATFIFIMDEWDSMFFNDMFTEADQKDFLMFLKQLLKDQGYVDFAYMTGVLPIVKHSTGSELNMFEEFSAVNSSCYSEYFGFTEAEVKNLCQKHKDYFKEANKKPEVNFDGLKFWYDGYLTKTGEHMFNPRSTALALKNDELSSYWTDSGPYSEIYYCVKHNIDAVRDDLARMIAGEPVPANMRNYAASSMSFSTKDEIFSAMVVYGFLTYYKGCVSIPNHELMLKFQEVMEKDGMKYIAKLVKRSEETLAATLRRDEEVVAEIIEAAHDQEIPLLRYAHEADLAALINLVYLSARDNYFVKREEPAGKGVADVAFIPMDPNNSQLKPFIVELKVAQDTEDAKAAALRSVEQIKEKGYTSTFADNLSGEKPFANTPLAVGISWDPKQKKHACTILELDC